MWCTRHAKTSTSPSVLIRSPANTPCCTRHLKRAGSNAIAPCWNRWSASAALAPTSSSPTPPRTLQSCLHKEHEPLRNGVVTLSQARAAFSAFPGAILRIHSCANCSWHSRIARPIPDFHALRFRRSSGLVCTQLFPLSPVWQTLCNHLVVQPEHIRPEMRPLRSEEV